MLVRIRTDNRLYVSAAIDLPEDVARKLVADGVAIEQVDISAAVKAVENEKVPDNAD